MSTRSQATYRAVEGWERLPAGQHHRDVADVAVDSRDRVYLITRMDARVIVYDRDGTHLMSWGEDAFTTRPHGITVGPDGTVYCVDEYDQTIRKFTSDGRPTGVIGVSGVTSDTGIDWSRKFKDLKERKSSILRGAPPFNHPTKLAVAPDGDLYVSDGYGNARVHHFTAGGELVNSWGEPGRGAGKFVTPHCVAVHDGHVWVCDRDNDRIQIFDRGGRFVDQWRQVQRPSSIAFDAEGLVYVTEQGWKRGDYSWSKGDIGEALPASLCILTGDGSVVDRIGTADGCRPGSFVAPHGLAVDSRGDIYVAEVVGSWFLPDPAPEGCHTFQKLERG
jgi:DNA-binding beta-propeller fold protein YncE